MNYESTLAAYKALLVANPGHALHLGSSTVAVMQDGELRAAHIHAEGRIDLHKSFEFIEDAWDEDSECWENEDSAADTLRHINDPQLIPVNLAHQEALRALRADDLDCPALVEVRGLLTPDYSERVRAVCAHYGMPSPY